MLFVSLSLQLFYSFFKSLVGKEVIVELKNDLWYVRIIPVDFDNVVLNA